MQEETHSVSTTPSLPSHGNSSLIKELSIPISIVLAGIFIGAGLYFGGAPAGGSVEAVANLPEEKTPKTLLGLALAAGVEEEKFTKCFENGETLAAVQEDVDDAVETGGRGTPWGIVIGPTGTKYPLNGALPQQAIEQLIEVAKAEAGSETATENAALEKMNPVTDQDNIKGNINATVKIVEYSDFDCPFCTRFHATMNSIVTKYSPDEVAWVYRHFPLEQLHPQAKAVAVASECVAEIGGNDAFWKFADSYLK